MDAMSVIDHPTNARSRRTRAALLDAARRILEDAGFEALTMAAVAQQAGVTRRTVYLHFASRTDLVDALFDHLATVEGLEASTQPVWAAPDAATALDEWARHLARYHPRLLAVTRAVERVQRADPDAARHRDRVVQAQLANCRRLAAWLDREGQLAPPWTTETATDMLWALISSDLIAGLLIERGWPTERFAEHVAVLLRSTFVKDRTPHGEGTVTHS
jgi:AcrR family transcriptional regulator